MLLFAIGTPAAVTAGLAYLLAHACYKGALFLVAGAVEHETGTRDVSGAGGPAARDACDGPSAGLAAASMAGDSTVRWVYCEGAAVRQRSGLRLFQV